MPAHTDLSFPTIAGPGVGDIFYRGVALTPVGAARLEAGTILIEAALIVPASSRYGALVFQFGHELTSLFRPNAANSAEE